MTDILLCLVQDEQYLCRKQVDVLVLGCALFPTHPWCNLDTFASLPLFPTHLQALSSQTFQQQSAKASGADGKGDVQMSRRRRLSTTPVFYRKTGRSLVRSHG
jgi:hypothetical protein